MEDEEVIFFLGKPHCMLKHTFYWNAWSTPQKKKGITVFPVACLLLSVENAQSWSVCAVRWTFGQCLISPLDCLYGFSAVCDVVKKET